MDVAQYSPQEIRRLRLGWMVRERPAEQHSKESSSQKRKIRAGQQEAREEMLEDVGVH